ncbi:MAG: right-handed parallel beta-helix repeat-containing protein [Deltaproteobacteria bacterium]|nr:right-handed parallel beta-helix repeat-containing protein [Deltaproteobacteria bacterium]
MLTSEQGSSIAKVLLIAVTLVYLAGVGSSVSHAAVFDVTNSASSGAGSLRAAIDAANANGVPDVITFGATTELAGCPFVITLADADGQLPRLTDPGTTIDGTACGVTLDGSGLTNATSDGLRVRASNTVIRGLTIRNFPQDGMRIQPEAGANLTVTGVVITKNVFSGNLDGLRVSGGDGPGNMVSATIANNQFIENRDDGIRVDGSFGDSTDGGNKVRVVISNNLVEGSAGVVTGGATTGDGIRVFGGPGSSGRGANGGNEVVAIISNNETRNNVDDGILVAGTGSGNASNHTVFAKIVGNKTVNNGAPASTAANGIVVRGGSTEDTGPFGSRNTVVFLVADNESERNKDDGIRIAGGLGDHHFVRGVASNNKMDRNGLRGISVSGSDGTDNTLKDIDIVDNDVNRSGDAGIRVAGGGGGNAALSNITIKGNKSKLNEEHGIEVLLGAGGGNVVSLLGITDNATNQNRRDGIFVGAGVSGSGSTPVSANQAIANREDGIDLNSTGYVVIANEVKGSIGAGIDAVGNIDGGGNFAVGNGSCNTPGCF